MSRIGGVALAALALVACVHGPAVERVYGGRVVEGMYVAPLAYAAFLRGSIAEGAGDAKGALAGYEEAVRLDPNGSEIRARIAALSRAPPPASPQLWGEGASGRGKGDPLPQNWGMVGAGVREVLVALAATASDQVAGWDALAQWARAHGDVVLWGRALGRLAKNGPARRRAAARAAEELAGAGEIGEARAVAAAAADAGEAPLPEQQFPLAARLAVDEAIARRDPDAMRRRSTRVRLGLDEASARAMLAGERGLARDLARLLWRADSQAAGAMLVLAAGEGGDALGAAATLRRDGVARVPAAALVAFGLALAHAASPDDARAALASIQHDPILGGDDLVVRPAVALVVRGLLDEAALPAPRASAE